MMTPPTIVIVEDDPAMLMLLDTILTRAGYATLLATTGKEAHQLIQQAQPDLVILDLSLEHPYAGEMVLGWMDLDPTTKAVPVIACSGDHVRLRDTADRFQHMVSAVIAKPFLITEMLETVRRVLEPPAVRERGA